MKELKFMDKATELRQWIDIAGKYFFGFRFPEQFKTRDETRQKE
jgi:hypothetical protein